jgi:adenylate kinase family enzyme
MAKYDSKLIILRGNSGSGKSTVARQLREMSSRKVMIIEQDVVRRNILKQKETDHETNIALMTRLVEFGLVHKYDIILEGILGLRRYGEMIRELCELIPESYLYYFDISFEETLRRHSTKPNAHEFGEKEMREWWREKDLINLPYEKIIPQEFSLEDTIDFICKETGI